MQIRVENLQKNYGRKMVLRSVSFTAESGNCIGILGGNGSGKSTLLSVLAGVQRGKGALLCDGKDLLKNRKLHTACVGYVPQGTPLIEELSAKDNLRLWYDKADLEQQLKSGVLKMLGIDQFLKTSVSKMSGGMKKRLSIGCAVAKKQPILLLDEPTAALDLVCKEEIRAYLEAYKKAGGILILVTHDVRELELCDQLYVLKDGLLQEFDYNGSLQTLVDQLK